MFNAPRRTGASLSSSAFLNASAASGHNDPLASSTPNPTSGGFGEVDPWSSVPSPARIGTPSRRDSDEEVRVPGGMAGSIGGAGLNGLMSEPPAQYIGFFDALEPSSSGEVSLSSVQRLLSTSKLPASTIEKIINLTSRDRSSLSRQEFFCALALVSLAQTSPSDPDDTISIERLSESISNLPLPRLQLPANGHSNGTGSGFGYVVSPPLQTSSNFSPWDTAPRQSALPSRELDNGEALENPDVERERGYWKRLEVVEVSLIAEKEGWFLQKYRVESDKRTGGAVTRRYSDFVWLLDCLTKRYPFRLLPALPPKRVGPDANFLEQRRKGLQRFLNMVVNHPVMKDDGALNVFLTEPNFEAWRKRTKVSTDEESASKKLNAAQEMAIPSDLDEKLNIIRTHLPSLLTSYQKLVTLSERSLARLQAASADASRLAMSLQTVGENIPQSCYRSAGGHEGCTLCVGVGKGLGEVGEGWMRIAEEGEKRAQTILLNSVEALKSQRDLYACFRDLFTRHDRLSKDSVDALRKKVDQRQKKIETLRNAQKPNWETEVEKLLSATDADTFTIDSLLSRRIFIKACMWHELAVVFHTRQAAQATLGWRGFVGQQIEGEKAVLRVWEGLRERLEVMPVE